MDIKDILSPSEKDAPRSVSSTPGSPVQSPFKYVQRAQSGPLQALKPGPGASPLSQSVMTQSNIPAHVLSPAQQTTPSPLISPVPASISNSQFTRASSTASMDALADLASSHNHQSSRPGPTPLRMGRNSYGSQKSPSFSAVIATSLTSNPRASFDINMLEAPRQAPRTDFSDSSLRLEKQERLSELVNYIQENPSAYESYVEIVKILHDGFVDHIYPPSNSSARRDPRTYTLLPDLRNARESMEKLFAVGESLWIDWLQDESILAQSAEERIAVVEKFRRAVEEEVGSVKLWAAYGDWVHHCFNWAHDNSHESNQDSRQDEERLVGRELFTGQLVQDTWQEAADQTKYNLAESHITWSKYLESRFPHPDRILAKEEADACMALFHERLHVPHTHWDATFQSFSSFVSANREDEYESIMVDMNRSAAHTKQKIQARESYELAIDQAQTSEDRDAEYLAFSQYTEWERTAEKRKKLDIDLINAIFERAELRFPSDTILWEEHAAALLEASQTSLLMLLERAAKHCPWSGSLWSQYLLTSDRMGQTFQETENIKHKATSTGLLEAAGIEEVVKVHTAWCSFLRRRSSRPDGSEEDNDVAEMGIRSSIEIVSSLAAKLGLGESPDPSFQLHRIHITFLTESGRWDNARQEFDTLVREYGKSWEFWMRFYQWEMARWRRFASAQQESDSELMESVAPPQMATAVLKKALEQPSLDYPEPIMEAFITHCEDYEDAEELQQALLKVHKLKKTVAARRHVEAIQSAQNIAFQEIVNAGSDSQVPPTSKRKREDDGEADRDGVKKNRSSEDPQQSVEEASVELLKRDREHATVLVQNLPDHIPDNKIRQYFSNCGLIKSMKVLREDNISAVLEFEDDAAARYALSRDGQEYEGAILSVSLDTGSTLYIANYTAAADERYIRSLLEEFGDIINIRFPSLQGNKNRRFCYVQFKLPAQAQSATRLDGKEIDGLSIVCKISNPAVRKPRDNKPVTSDGKVVFVGQLDFKMSEDELGRAFADCGEIEMIRMPRNETMKNRNKGIAFITFVNSQSAEKALSLHGHEVNGRHIKVTVATSDARRGTAVRQTGSPNPVPNGETKSEAPSVSSVETLTSSLRDRQIFLTNIADTVNESRIRAVAQKFGSVARVVLKTNHQGAILEFSSVPEAGEAAIRLEGYELSPGRHVRVVDESEMLSTSRDKKPEDIVGQPVKPVLKALPIGVSGPIKRPGQLGARKGGNLGQRSAALFSQPMANAQKEQINGDFNKKTNDDFKALFNEGR